MKWKKIWTGAIVLGICSAFSKLLGAFFRIPLTNILGAEGIGLYQMVFPLYTVLLTISSGGLSSAISKVVANSEANGDSHGSIKIVKVSIATLLILAGTASAFLIIFRVQIANLQGNSKAALAYLAIAPAIVFVAVIACIRGFFQGKGNMLPSGISQIVEQVFKVIFGLYFAARFINISVSMAVLGAMLGLSLSELAAMLILLAHFLIRCHLHSKSMRLSVKKIKAMTEAGEDFAILSEVNFQLKNDKALNEKASANQLNSKSNNIYPQHKKSKKSKQALSSFGNINSSAALAVAPYNATQNQSTSDILKSLYKTAIPITLGSLIMPLTQVIDSILVINILTSSGLDKISATSMFGLFSGPINSLINLPIAIMLSISIALLPKLSYLRQKQNNSINKLEEPDFEYLNTSNKNNVPIKSKSKNKSEQSESDKVVKNALKTSIYLSLPAAALLLAFSDIIIPLLYSGGLNLNQQSIAISLLKIESLSIFYISIIQVATASLQGADKPHRPAINLLYGAVLKVMLSLLLLPILGIRGAAAASVSCYALIAIIDLAFMKKEFNLALSLKSIVFPLMGCVVMIALGFLSIWLFKFFFGKSLSTILGLAVAGLSYLIFLIVTKSIIPKQLFK